MRTILTLASLSLLASCHTPTAAATPQVAAITKAEATAVLDAQVARWNQGDLPGFVATYWDGPELTFLGGSGITRGRKDLLTRYQKAYPTAEDRGALHFEVIEFQQLGAEHALLLGQYTIERKFRSTGFFSLVLARREGAIVILHDHTSETRKP